jgi:hypothetical protein
MGPPDENGGPRSPHRKPAALTSTHNTPAPSRPQRRLNSNAGHAETPGKRLVWIPCTRSYPQDTASQLKRRRDAGRRLPTLDCGCADPWPCRRSEPPLTEKMIDAGRDAALHLLRCNAVPLLKFEVLQALWRRGGADRVLAEILHEACGGEIG